jgi:DNA-binding XRE family transcriptional regulator
MEPNFRRPDEKAEIAKRFKDIRKNSSMTQLQLAEIIGICRQAVSKIEHRHTMPHISTWNRFADLEARHAEARRVSASMEPFFWRKPLSNS